MAIKRGEIVTHHDGLPPINSYNPLNVCLRVKKLKTFYFRHHIAYRHKSHQRSDITQGVPAHNFA